MPTLFSSRTVCWLLFAVLGITTLSLLPTSAGAARKKSGGLKAITLAPAKVEGVAKPQVLLPSFSVRNTTGKDYNTTVYASFLLQSRTGGVMVETNAARIREASRLVKINTQRFKFPNGAKGGTVAALMQPTADHNFYGTITFSSRPVDTGVQKGGASIRQALEISSSLFMRPQRKYTRVGFTSQPCFVRQLAPRQLGYFAPVKNTGNIHAFMSGNARVERLDSVKVVSRRNPVKRLNQLPSFIVDHKAVERKVLPAGMYRIRMRVSGRGKNVYSTCTMRLVGPNTLAATDADLTALDTPRAYYEHKVDVHGRYKNTGNIAFTPQAVLQVKYAVGAKKGKVYKSYKMEVGKTEPGKQADISGTVDALPTRENYEFKLVLLDDRGYELDSRTVPVNQSKAPSLWERFMDWLRRHIILVLAGIAALLLLLGLVLAWRRRRRKQQEAEADRAQRLERMALQHRLAKMEALMAQEQKLREEAGLNDPPAPPLEDDAQ